MTPLQQAAQELLELHLPTYLDTHVSQLRTALEAEQAQAVEPVAWLHRDDEGDLCAQEEKPSNPDFYRPVFFHPPHPPASDHVPEAAFGTTERSALIARLRLGASISRERRINEDFAAIADDAADMLEADAQEIAATVRQVEILSDELSKCSKAQQVAVPYDQQALELCLECGWKAIMPGEPCFVCNMQAYGQQVRAAALEETAQVCSHKAETKRLYLNESHYLECAEAIRSLK